MPSEFIGMSPENSKLAQELKSDAEDLLPHLGEHWQQQFAVMSSRLSISRLLFLNFLYNRILNVPGHILEFGVQWGATLSQLIGLRSIYEPFNVRRLIYGFDTFTGLKGVSRRDHESIHEGDYSVSDDWSVTLNRILEKTEKSNPLGEMRRTFTIKGDASQTVDFWLEENPDTPAALVFLDMDIYEPTKIVLEKVKERLIPGSVVVLDEFNHPMFPGERAAALEVFGNVKFELNSLYGNAAYFVITER